LPAAAASGYKGNHLFDELPFQAPATIVSAMTATKFYFYFFWYLRPLADREG